MENEIKVGEWIRTKYGEIGIVTETYPRLKWRKKKASSDLDFNSIVKHSPNLIDLIQCGDYVNGRLVLQVDYKNQNICLLIPLTDTKANTNIMWYGYEDIKTIVTKEQFESISYKVERK